MPNSEIYSDPNSLHNLFEPLENDPDKRRETREAFYLKYGYGMNAVEKLQFFFKWLRALFMGKEEELRRSNKKLLRYTKDEKKQRELNRNLVQAERLDIIRKHDRFFERIGLFIRWLFEGQYGFGRSELDFMDWEIKRGALDPEKGSAWWREVNFLFIVISECAALLYEKKTNLDAVNEYLKSLVDQKPLLQSRKSDLFKNERTKWWIYINRPGGQSWYRAHNSTIVSGYSAFNKLAGDEIAAEQEFINEVLYRLVFAQSMEEGATFLKHLGTQLANPILPAVDIITAIPALYPRNYPLSDKDINNVEHKGHNLGSALENILDSIVLSNLNEMYNEASWWNKTPELKTYASKENEPMYPTHNRLLKNKAITNE